MADVIRKLFVIMLLCKSRTKALARAHHTCKKYESLTSPSENMREK